MRERPILFSTEMVKAILAGRKTMTRRIVKGNALEWLNDDFTTDFVSNPNNDQCPLGRKGDLLWVRESHKVTRFNNTFSIKFRYETIVEYYFKQLSLNLVKKLNARKSLNKSWMTGRFLPKEIARIWLEITDIKIERLNDISDADAIAEGIQNPKREEGKIVGYRSAVSAFAALWFSINGESSWQANPWVWVISFKVLSTTGKP